MDSNSLKKKLANVASSQRLQLTKEELDMFSEQLKDVLEAFDQLDQINTTNVKPSYHPIQVPTTMRDDVVEKSTAPTQNHAKKEKGYLIGPRMM